MRRLWIDCDVALGVPLRDPDDGFALAIAALAPDVELLGVSTVFGNTTVDRATRSAARLLAVLGAHVPLVAGAARAGEVTDAAHAIAALPGGTSLLALGPLTNVAAALAIDPGLASRIDVRAVGGNLSSWGCCAPWWPFEFNLAKDPAATAAFFAAPFGVRRRMFPLDVVRRLRIGPFDLTRLARSGPVGRALAVGSASWLAYAPLRYRDLRFPLWDVVPTLEAVGALDVASEPRALMAVGRGDLRAGPPTTWATAFDAARALRSALTILADPPIVTRV